MKYIITFLFLSLFIGVGYTQDGTPTDYLSKDFHKDRRDALRSKMPKNSVAVFFANPIRNRANDVDYIYHQDPNFYYLTGYREPNAVLLIFSDKQVSATGDKFDEVLYVQERNARAEQWNGKRLGVEGAQEKLGFKMAFNGKEFLDANIYFKNFDNVFIDGKFKDDYRETNDEADIFSLIKNFKIRSGYNPGNYLSNIKKYVYAQIKNAPENNKANVIASIKRYESRFKEIKEDSIIQSFLKSDDKMVLKDAKKRITLALQPQSNIDINFVPSQMATLREVKSKEELKLLTKAVRISAVGQVEVMKAMKPNMSETELQGIHEFVYKKYGAEYEGYPSIVGAGNNGCILHYIENNRMSVGNDLVLMDLGAEYRGYTADVTRTIPANGKFSPEQKAIYDLVYEAQEAGIAKYVIGESMQAPNMEARKVVNAGLVKLGIIKSIDERHDYFPHGTSHHIGLDVHDPGNYRNFEENMVVTMEPGIYIPIGSPCDKKWWGIGVRIEDDILVTKKGPVNLSGDAPRKSDEIEKMMAKPSVLDAFILPDLDKE